MSASNPQKVLITGGKPAGGIDSFARALASGFNELGLAAEVIEPISLLARWNELRNPRILKILSTRAVYAAPLARRAIAMAHGFPCVAHQGWPTTLGVLASFKLATLSRGTQLVVVSDYSALHLGSIFGIRVDAVIRNPMLPLFSEAPADATTREAITYVGRLHHSKNVHKLLPAMRDILARHPGLSAWIIGDGPERVTLQAMAATEPRIKFFGALPPIDVRDRLRHTRVVVSANPTEPFGIVYLEALSQGCAVAMPTSGGGLEIAPDQIGKSIHLFPSSVEQNAVATALEQALATSSTTPSLTAYSASAVARAYLAVDARFDAQGYFEVEGAASPATLSDDSVNPLQDGQRPVHLTLSDPLPASLTEGEMKEVR